MADQELVELSEEEWDTLDALLDKVWQTMNRELSADTMSVPTSTYVRAGEKRGYTSSQVRRRLSTRDDFHKLQYTAPDGKTPVHTWYRGATNNPPDDYLPRLPEKVRLTADGALREIYPDRRYRFNKRQWWGFQLIKAANAGELA